jgi:hypothetical protein
MNIVESNSIPKPPVEMGLLIYLGRYEIKVNNAQLLQNVATVIAIKGKLVSNFLNGSLLALESAGASDLINSNSSGDICLWS